jgi:hypothetical protein
MRLGDLAIGTEFKCSWRIDPQPVVTLYDVTLSAAWVKFTEEKEFKRKNRKTGEIKIVKAKVTTREPWSLGTDVEVIE